MARLITEGIKEMEDRLKNLEKSLQARIMPEMINAGADALIESWKDTIQEKGHVRTGAMLESVGKTAPMMSVDGIDIDVYPQGTDSHRITNAQKAFIIHYGREANRNGKKKITGDKFVTLAENRAREKVNAAMQAVLDKYVSGKD